MNSADAGGEGGEGGAEGEGGEVTAPIKRQKKKADPNTAKGKKQVRWEPLINIRPYPLGAVDHAIHSHSAPLRTSAYHDVSNHVAI